MWQRDDHQPARVWLAVSGSGVLGAQSQHHGTAESAEPSGKPIPLGGVLAARRAETLLGIRQWGRKSQEVSRRRWFKGTLVYVGKVPRQIDLRASVA